MPQHIAVRVGGAPLMPPAHNLKASPGLAVRASSGAKYSPAGSGSRRWRGRRAAHRRFAVRSPVLSASTLKAGDARTLRRVRSGHNQRQAADSELVIQASTIELQPALDLGSHWVRMAAKRFAGQEARSGRVSRSTSPLSIARQTALDHRGSGGGFAREAQAIELGKLTSEKADSVVGRATS